MLAEACAALVLLVAMTGPAVKVSIVPDVDFETDVGAGGGIIIFDASTQRLVSQFAHFWPLLQQPVPQ